MQNLNTIPLAALRVIEAVGRTGTLSRAAHEMGVTSGALSQRLAKAEASLGQTLFIRTSTGLIPTDACSAILPRLSHAITGLSEVVSDLRNVEQSVLTVSVAPIFASRWLIWRIRRFNEQHPTISVRLDPNAEILELDRAGVDIGIRVGANLSPGKHATKLLDQRVFPVCSPDIGQSITSISDLLELPVIRENDELYGWNTWLSGQGPTPSDLRHGPIYGDASLCLDAAMTGQGVFMAWETLACDALERGQVIDPLQRRTTTDAAYWFVTTKFSSPKKTVSTFKKWLEDELACSNRNWLNQCE